MRASIGAAVPRSCQRLAALTLSLALFLQLAAGSLLIARHLGEMVLLAELGTSICGPDGDTKAPGKPARQMPHCECCTIGGNSFGAGATDIPRIFEVVARPVDSAGWIRPTPGRPVGDWRYASNISARGPPLEKS